MSKYIGIKPAEIIGEDMSLPGIIAEIKEERKPKYFLMKFLICCLFVAAFILLGYIENPVIESMLDTIYKAITFDLIGTDPSECLINGWLLGLA